MKVIQYYLVPKSPWTYLGHERLMAIAERHGAQVQPRPFALAERVFQVSGGLPLPKRPPQRQAYRLVELRRWSDYLNLPLNLQPRYFPVDDSAACRMIILASQTQGDQAGNRLAGAFLKAVWAQDLNLADHDTLVSLADQQGLDGRALYDANQQAQATYDDYTQQAIDLQVFGAPWYVYNGEPFWGQDRLDFLDRALSQG
jgi:2-hydroxychromene-2-carboxylate isomerase